MVPKITKPGSCFFGAWSYYAHDKRSEQDKMRQKAVKTSARVAWMHTENLAGMKPGGACAKAMQMIASLNAHCQKPVYAFSLAWHPEENPDRKDMIAAGQGALKTLGMEEHMAVFIAHNDTDHAHIHILVNRVHPGTLKAKNNFQDWRRLSEWALNYERARGKIYCPVRGERAALRAGDNGCDPHPYPDTTLLDAWSRSDSGRSFQAALAAKGWTLCLGDRKDRFMALLPSGKPIDILREINKTRPKERKLKIADLPPGGLQRVAALRAAAQRASDFPSPDWGRPQAETRAAIEKNYQIEQINQAIEDAQAQLSKKGGFIARITGRHARAQAAIRAELTALRRNLADAQARAAEQEQRLQAARQQGKQQNPALPPARRFSFPTGPNALKYSP